MQLLFSFDQDMTVERTFIKTLSCRLCLRKHSSIIFQMLTYLMLIRLANLCPNAVLQRKLMSLFSILLLLSKKTHCSIPSYANIFIDLNSLVEPLRATIQQKVKASSVKQEFEKQDELKRSALRATVALLNVPDSSKYYILKVLLKYLLLFLHSLYYRYRIVKGEMSF